MVRGITEHIGHVITLHPTAQSPGLASPHPQSSNRRWSSCLTSPYPCPGLQGRQWQHRQAQGLLGVPLTINSQRESFLSPPGLSPPRDTGQPGAIRVRNLPASTWPGHHSQYFLGGRIPPHAWRHGIASWWGFHHNTQPGMCSVFLFTTYRHQDCWPEEAPSGSQDVT